LAEWVFADVPPLPTPAPLLPAQRAAVIGYDTDGGDGLTSLIADLCALP
jgi:hypothetical protein